MVLSSLRSRLNSISGLSDDARTQVFSQADQLLSIGVPQSLSRETAEQLRNAISGVYSAAFIAAMVMLAGAAALGGVAGVLLIRQNRNTTE